MLSHHPMRISSHLIWQMLFGRRRSKWASLTLSFAIFTFHPLFSVSTTLRYTVRCLTHATCRDLSPSSFAPTRRWRRNQDVYRWETTAHLNTAVYFLDCSSHWTPDARFLFFTAGLWMDWLVTFAVLHYRHLHLLLRFPVSIFFCPHFTSNRHEHLADKDP